MDELKYSGGIITLPNGDRFHATVFLIHTRDRRGRPALVKLIPDDYPVLDLEGSEEFFVAYVAEKELDKGEVSNG